MELYLIRHGETEDNLRRVIQGQTQGKLTPLGEKQAAEAHDRFKELYFDHIFCSDLHRALHTAQIIFGDRENIVINEDVRLRERFFGAMQGDVIDRGFNYCDEFEGVEPIAELVERVRDFVEELKREYPDKKIAVVSHGVTIKVFVHLYGEGGEINAIRTVKNCELLKFKI